MNKFTTIALCLLATASAAFARGHHSHHSAPPQQGYYYQPAPPPPQQGGYYQPAPPPPPQQGYYYQPAPPPPQQGGYYQPAPPPPQQQGGRHGHHHGGQGGMAMLGEFSAGSAKEVVIGGGRSSVVIEVVAGSITINTVVLRRAGQKQSITVAARFNQGQRHVIPIDGAVTGIRISDGGKGRYRVYAQ